MPLIRVYNLILGSANLKPDINMYFIHLIVVDLKK